MKKLFSILLVVVMIASLSVVSFAAAPHADGGMHTVITETDDDITVQVILKNVASNGSFTSYLKTTAVSYVADSAVAGDKYATAKITPTTDKADYIKFVVAYTDTADYITDAGSFVALTYKVTKTDPAAELSETDFAYGTGTLDISKVVTSSTGTVAGITAGNNFTSKKQPAYFTIEYVDARTPVTPDEPVVPDEPTYPQIKDDEVFEDGEIVGDDGKVIETTAATKSIAVFGKAASDLAAKSYGVRITMGENVYTFPGLAPVEAGKLWAVKVITPDGSFNFKDGAALADYTVEAY